MQLIIPMSGRGDRFLRAGYRVPKPLIPIEGKPIVEHVLNLFPGVEDVVFVCNTEHLAATPLRAVLQRLRPAARVVAIEPHNLGPVHATLQAAPWIPDDDEVIVNYCDFSARWDFARFRRTVREVGCDGCITAYRGFHPHSLGPTFYAYLRHQDHWMEEIQEKACFTDNRMEEYASAGTYYFARGRHVTRYFAELVRRQQSLNGEYYVSLVYNLMRADGLRTWVYELDQFLQWGTPEDLEEYLGWSEFFHGPGARGVPAAPTPGTPQAAGTNLVPMAGAGRRFQEAGYTVPKPFVPVDGAPMVVQAVRAYPAAARWVFVAQQSHLAVGGFADTVRRQYPSCTIVSVDGLTAGQASTCQLAEPHVPPEAPLFIGACDHSMVWDPARFVALAGGARYDALIWTFQGHAGVRRHPQMYSYVEVAPDGVTALRVSTKVPLSDRPDRDHAVVGAFWFRRAKAFFDAVRHLMAMTPERPGGEWYVDTCLNAAIALGMTVGVFQIDRYIGWGTPDELKTYEYWSRYFRRAPDAVHRAAVL